MKTYLIARNRRQGVVTEAELLPTDLIHFTDGRWRQASDWFRPQPPASVELCYEAPAGRVCARATGPAPAILGAFALGIVVGIVFFGTPLA